MSIAFARGKKKQPNTAPELWHIIPAQAAKPGFPWEMPSELALIHWAGILVVYLGKDNYKAIINKKNT